MREPIRDFRAGGVREVAEQRAASLAEVAEAEAMVAGAYRLRTRRRGEQAQDANTLISLSSTVSTIEDDTLYLSKEVSLVSTASELWTELSASMSDNGATHLRDAAAELGASMQCLGRAAQASLVAGPGSARQSQAWELAKAGSRAQAAVKALEELASTCAVAADDVLVRSGGLRRLDKGWRRDALRAILSLEQAPERLQLELKQQRLAKLSAELAMLGLQDAPLESLSEADVRAARARRAKAIHPDMVARRPFLGSLFGGGHSRRRQAEVARAHDAMSELNAAHDAVRKAVIAPMYL